jgi:hypothetical protein
LFGYPHYLYYWQYSHYFPDVGAIVVFVVVEPVACLGRPGHGLLMPEEIFPKNTSHVLGI